jgi:hypothetical protein
MQSIPLRSPGDAAKLARDLKKDLGHLRRRGVDPSTFLGGALASIAARIENAASRSRQMTEAERCAWYGQYARVC